MNRQHFYIYPEDKNGKKTGHTICVIVRDNRAFFGIAVCSNEDNFEYSKGRDLAYERALEQWVKYEDRNKA